MNANRPCRGLRDTDNQESFAMFCISAEERLRDMACIVDPG
jgi:hypothetical protein